MSRIAWEPPIIVRGVSQCAYEIRQHLPLAVGQTDISDFAYQRTAVMKSAQRIARQRRTTGAVDQVGV